MASEHHAKQRFFKTAWFAKAAHVTDQELCAAMLQVLLGQADDLGGGVFKKRLNRNLHRSILVARRGRYWIYTYLFAKQDKANLKDDELIRFRALATSYSQMSDETIEEEVVVKELTEICHGSQQM